MSLFKKAAIFGDIHFGMKNNSNEHNGNCSNFIDWFIETAIAEGCETCIFLGDWHHVRANINVSTMNYSIENLKKLDKAFDKSYFIVGNHDLYYKNSRELNSLPYTDLFDNIELISEITERDDCLFLPWLVDNEWKSVSKQKAKYVFGHLELPYFKMNAIVEMPDHGELQPEHFKDNQYVLSGHFHKRQKKENIYYIGNPFPHNFADAWDDDRGMVTMEWGDGPKFFNWHEGPKFRTIRLSHLLTNPTEFIDDNTYARITLDIELNFEEMNFIKDMLIRGLKAKEISMIFERSEELENEFAGEIEFETVDQIVVKQLQNVESNTYDPELLVNLYNLLEI